MGLVLKDSRNWVDCWGNVRPFNGAPNVMRAHWHNDSEIYFMGTYGELGRKWREWVRAYGPPAHLYINGKRVRSWA